MLDDEVNESQLDYETKIKALQEKTATILLFGNLQNTSIRSAIEYYVIEGDRLGLSSGELTDFFCVSTPNALEMAGFVGADGESVTALFDEIHDQFRRSKSGL